MNHLSRKKKLYGAGKKPKVKPAVLQPPKIGNFQFGASFSYIETLDLISDGPIEGLVDNKGDLLYEKEQSRGVYLDGTPVSIATAQYQDPDSESSSSDDKKVSKAISTFQNLNTNDKGGASVFDYAQGGPGSRELDTRRTVKVSFEPLVENIKPFLRGGNLPLHIWFY